MWLERFRTTPERRKAVEATTLSQVRATRFQLSLPISFAADGNIYSGVSLNVSDSGLLATCDQVPDLWVDGELSLEAGEHYLNIHARVARIDGNNVGFAFSILTENDRAAIGVLINSASDCPVTCIDPSVPA